MGELDGRWECSRVTWIAQPVASQARGVSRRGKLRHFSLGQVDHFRLLSHTVTILRAF